MHGRILKDLGLLAMLLSLVVSPIRSRAADDGHDANVGKGAGRCWSRLLLERSSAISHLQHGATW